MYRKSWLLAIIAIFILSFSWSIAVIKADDASTPEESGEIEVENKDKNGEEVEPVDKGEDEEESTDDTDEEEATDDPELKESTEKSTCEIGIAVDLNYGETIEICALQTLHIENTGSYIITPEGLPEGTEITVTDIREEAHVMNAEEEQGLIRTGDAIDVELDMPDEELIQPFTLNLMYDGTIPNPDIYYYEDGAWVEQGGFETVDDQVSVEVDHFSSYAVFSDTSGEPDPDPEPEVCDDEIVYTLGKDGDMEICADQKVNFIPDDSDEDLTIDQRTLAYIKTPSDLPDGTTIKVTDIEEDSIVKNAKKEQNIMVCGPVLSFDLTLPDSTSFDDSFMLHTIFCNGGDNPDIYYYNEDKVKWEKQDAETETKTPEELEENSQITMSIEVDSFSSYGVFDDIDETSKPKDDNGDDNKKDPSPKDKKDKNSDGDDKSTDDDEDSTTITVEDGDDEIASDDSILPSTATNMYNYLLIGGGLLVAGLLVYLLRRKFAAK